MTDNLTKRLADLRTKYAKEIGAHIFDGDYGDRLQDIQANLYYDLDNLAGELDTKSKQEASEQVAAVVEKLRQSFIQEAGELKGRADLATRRSMLLVGAGKIGSFSFNPTEILAQRDERITNELVVVYSCPHMLRYPECSICSPKAVRQAALEEAAKIVCRYCQLGQPAVPKEGLKSRFNHYDYNGWFSCKAQAIRKLMDSGKEAHGSQEKKESA